jgi:hypothetical protein
MLKECMSKYDAEAPCLKWQVMDRGGLEGRIIRSLGTLNSAFNLGWFGINSHNHAGGDSTLAIIELSFRSGASMRGYGVICAARKNDSEWGARCIPGWIS